MADCSRCSNERRFVRKELQRWAKNVLLLVGMERVAQELMGNRKWRKLMTPYNSLEQREPEDWSQQETCHFCNTKTQSPSDSTDNVVPLCDDLLDDNVTNTNTPNGDKCSVCAGLVTPNPDCQLCSSKSSKSTHSPINDQPLDLRIHQRHDKSVNADTHSGNGSELRDNCLIKVPQPSSTTKSKRNRLPTNSTWKRTYSEEELHAALRDIQSGKLGTRRAAVIYGIPRSTLRNKVYKLELNRSNGKRKVNASVTTTTAVANNNATSQSTSLIASSDTKKSNRTAYANREHDNTLLDTSSTLNNSSSTSASESLKQLLKQAITQRATNNSNIVAVTGNGGSSSGKTKSVSSTSSSSAQMSVSSSTSLLPAFNNLTDLYNHEALATTIHMLSTIDGGQALSLAPLFTQFLLSNIYQLALAKHHTGDSFEDFNNLSSASSNSILPDLIRKLAEDQLTAANQLSNRDIKTEPEEEEENGNSSNNNVILKVPSYKPKTSSSVTSSEQCNKQHQQEQQKVTQSDNCDESESVNKCTTSSQQESDESTVESKSFSLKEIIAKSISQRLCTTSAKLDKDSSANVAISEDSSDDAAPSDSGNGGNDGNDANDGNDGNDGCDTKNSGNISDHSNPSTPEKRNRPKRGRYRNYNRDDLAKAVRAVQRGEMSVHRAGTLFGVPHSTLEYKVKERHLLRPKKRHHDSNIGTKKVETVSKINGNNSQMNLNSNSNSTTNSNIRAINGTSNASSSVSCSSVANSSGAALNMPLWQSTAFPFFPVDISNSTNSANFFASNMMRKLQENARMNEEGLKNQQENSEYRGLLLESLIKSSLENKSTINKRRKSDTTTDNNDKEVLNTSLAVLKEVSSLVKKEKFD